MACPLESQHHSGIAFLVMTIKRNILMAAAGLVGCLIPAAAQPATDTASKAEVKLESALQRLAALRQSIAEEKIPLATERDQLFEELREVRKEADRAQRLRDNQSADLSAFEADLKAQGEVVDYLINLSSEFGRTLEAQLDPSERGFYADQIEAGQDAAEDPYLEEIEKVAAQTEVISLALDRMESLSGGATYPGKAVMPGGLLVDGTFARFGPITLFASDSGGAGLVENGPSQEPAVVTVAEGRYDQAISALASGDTAVIPLDSTLNNAMAIAATKESLLEHIQKGGIWIYPILMFAGLSLIVAAFKAFEIFTLPKPKEGVLGEILSHLSKGDTEKASSVANSAPGPVGRMLQQGVRYSKHDADLVDEILYESIVETQPRVMRLLPFISVTAAVAPLLGLLGTVTGMINTFNRIKIFGTGDAKSLSGGISEALITTEFGLIVAIPSLLLYALLSRKAKAFLARMEKMSISFVNGLKAIG